MNAPSPPPSVQSVLVWAQVAVLGFLSVDLIGSEKGKWLLREGGGIESVSAVLLSAAALLYLTYRGDRRNWHVSVGLILLAMRELDFDKRFTSEGVLQLRLYSGDSPWFEKLLGAAIVILAVTVLIRLAMFQFGPWMRGILKGIGWAWLFALSAALIVFAKSLDGIARKLAPLGVDISPEISDLSSRIEELFELFFALCLIATLTLSFRNKEAS